MRRPPRQSRQATRDGLTYLELVTVLGLTGLLALGGYVLTMQAKKNACRARARAALEYVYRSEILYCAVHGQFTEMFEALHSMGLPERLDPLYHFSLELPAQSSFLCQGWANLDADNGVDSLLVDETGIVRSLTKD